jgi:hypothetical protein
LLTAVITTIALCRDFSFANIMPRGYLKNYLKSFCLLAQWKIDGDLRHR